MVGLLLNCHYALLLHFEPMLAALMKEYYKSLSNDEQKRVNRAVAAEPGAR